MSDWGPGLLEATWVLIGLLLALAGVRSFLDQTNPRRVTTAAFWLLLACTFAFGSVLPHKVTGVILLVIAALSFARGVKTGTFDEGTPEDRETQRTSSGELAVRARAVTGRDRRARSPLGRRSVTSRGRCRSWSPRSSLCSSPGP